MLFASRISPWTQPVRAGLGLVRRAVDAGNRLGDLTWVGYNHNLLLFGRLFIGDPLVDVQRDAEAGVDFARQFRFRLVLDVATALLQFARTVRGLTQVFGSFNDAEFDEGRFEQHLAEDPRLSNAARWYWVRKLQARFFAGDYVAAVAAAANARSLLMTPGFFDQAEYELYAALARAALCDAAPATERTEHETALAAHHHQLEQWAALCPANFADRAALVTAEIARLEGRELDAERLYEQAIRSAGEYGFNQHEGLACELAARFYAARGFEIISHAYLRNARYCYLRWGANGKVRQLDELYPRLREGEPIPGPTNTIEAPVQHLDLATVIKVSQAVSGDMVPEKLLDTLLRTALAQAGAERGLLVLLNGGQLRVAAEAETHDDAVVVHLRDEPVVAATLPVAVVHYVLRIRESVILDDATAQPSFASDPYVRQHQTRSVLCLPLINKGQLIGVLYLENKRTPGVFAPTGIAVLKLLASQAAISLENSRLYRDLAEREAKVRRLVDSNTIGVFIWKFEERTIAFEGRIIEANDAFLRMAGYDREDLVTGRIRLADLSPPDWRHRTALAVEELKTTGTVQPFEKEYFRKDGSRVPVLIGAATFEQGGNQGVAFVLDLTERKCAEEAVRESEEKWRAVFENNPTMYFMMDAAGNVLSVNPFGAEQLGYTVDELTGDSVLKVFHEDDRAAAQRSTAACLEQLGKTLTWEARKVRKDGSMLWVRETARAMLMKGRPVVLTACEDMTQKKRAEEDLRRSEAFLAEAQKLTRTGSWAWDTRSQKVLYCSEEMFRIFGLDRESLATRKRLRERVHPADRAMVDARFERTLREKVDSFGDENDHPPYRIVLPDGTLKYINSSGHPVLDDDGNLIAFVGTAVDVTERKRAQEERERLRQLESDLAHMNRLNIMGELAASLAHEITQPIASARNNAQAAINFLDKQPPEFSEVREALGCVVGDADRAGDIIDRVRDHIKKAPPRKDHFEFNEAVKEVIVLAQGAITKNGVSVETRFAERLPPVHGDRVQLQQVVLNLILNAVDAMGSFGTGERKLLVSIEHNQANGILVAVRDTGPGIAPHHRERVFETFYTTKSSGVGMGLSICRSIIDAHGGRLWADANKPRGAVFRFTLPTGKEVHDFSSGGSHPTDDDHADSSPQPLLSAKHDD